jgi:hypothetical protein
MEDEYYRNKTSTRSTYEQYYKEQLVLEEKSVVSYFRNELLLNKIIRNFFIH